MWYNASWLYRVKITVDHTKVPGDLTDYPVYVSLASLPAGFHSHVNSDGGDIRVTKSDGSTEVPRELVFYDSSADTGELFFKADGTLSSSSDTDFYIYYGNSGASNPANDATYGRENVWKSAYTGVYHLQEAANNTASGYKDSTANHRNGTGFSMALTAPQGKLAGKGQEFDGANDGIQLTGTINNYITNSTGTVTAWALSDITGDSVAQPYLARWVWADSGGYLGVGIANISGTDRVRAYSFAGGNDAAAATYSTAAWMHLAFRHAGGALYLYKDGSVTSDGSANNTDDVSGALYLAFGYSSGSTPYWDGKIDEVRFANTDLGANWITTEYNNTNSPGTFYTVGAETQNAVAVAVTKSLAYYVKTTPAAKTKSLQYAVKSVPAAKTKSLQYAVKYVPSAKTKSLQYAVKTTPAATTKSLRYGILTTPAAATKSLQYAVKSSTATTKSLAYAVKTAHPLTKSLQYGVKSTPAAITKSLNYRIHNDVAPIEKSLTYYVRRRTAITKSMTYEIAALNNFYTPTNKYTKVGGRFTPQNYYTKV